MRETPRGPWSSAREFEVVVLCCVWWTSALAAVLSIKDVTDSEDKSFPFSLATTGIVNGAVALVTQIVITFWSYRSPPAQAPARVEDIAPLGLLQGAELCCGNRALMLLALSYRTMLHMASPAILLSAAILVGLERLDLRTVAAILTLVIGGVVCSVGEMSTEGGIDSLGVVFALLGTCFAGARWILTQIYLQPNGRPTDDGTNPAPNIYRVLDMMRYQSLFAALAASVASALFEDGVDAALSNMPGAVRVRLAERLTVAALSIVVLTMAELRIVGLTSALTITVAATLHNLLFVLAGVVHYSERLNWLHGIGGVVVIAGATVYVDTRRSACLAAERQQLKKAAYEC